MANLITLIRRIPNCIYVYTEPAGQTVVNRLEPTKTGCTTAIMAKDGYLYVSVERCSRSERSGMAKSIYKKSESSTFGIRQWR
jgi:hypothetical protein